jgi:hypothetical protein
VHQRGDGIIEKSMGALEEMGAGGLVDARDTVEKKDEGNGSSF